MTAPTTLPALRAAVARILVARGEAADALRVSTVSGREHGARRVRCSIWPPTGTHPMETYAVAADELRAIDTAWAHLVAWLSDEYDRADDVAHKARRATPRRPRGRTRKAAGTPRKSTRSYAAEPCATLARRSWWRWISSQS